MLESKRKPILAPPRLKKKWEIYIDSEQCDGCGVCASFCSKELLKASEKTNSRMLHFIEIINPEECVGCSQCERLCPVTAIYIREIDLDEDVNDES